MVTATARQWPDAPWLGFRAQRQSPLCDPKRNTAANRAYGWRNTQLESGLTMQIERGELAMQFHGSGRPNRS
jgi:hypothetical protein